MDKPTLAIYWADTHELLSYRERHTDWEQFAIVSVTPSEVLLEHQSGRKVVIRGSQDPWAPRIPDPNSEA